MTVKDWITLTLSVLAFLISVVTAYFNLVRQTDDLRLVISATPGTFINDNRIELSEFTVSLINAGNRNAIVHYIWVLIDQTTEGKAQTNCAQGTEVGVDGQPLIIKEKEILPKQIQAVPMAGGDKPGVPITAENLQRGYFPYEVCLGFFLSTPSETMIYRRVSIIRSSRYDLNGGFSDNDGEKAKDRAVVLIKRNGNIFLD